MNRYVIQRLAWGFGIVLTGLGVFAPAARAMDMEPDWLGTPYMEGWVPERADVVRGVLVLNGFDLDERWLEACAYWKFAILRINTDKYGESLPDDAKHAPLRSRSIDLNSTALAQGLDELAKATGRPEVRYVPMVTAGYSRFSPSAPRFMDVFPDRALGFMNGHGGGQQAGPPDNRAPSLGMQSEWENIFSGGDKTQLLDNWWSRPDGNMAANAITWRVFHSPATYADLGIPFIDQLIKHRIPADWDPRQGPCKLKPLKEADGWLGSHAGWNVPIHDIFQTDNQNALIAPYAEFAADKQRASWLIDEQFAWVWRAYSSRFPLVEITRPGSTNLILNQDPAPRVSGHREWGLRSGQAFEIEAKAMVAGVTRIEFFANTHKLGESTAFTGGETALGSTRHAVCSITATIDSPGIHSIMTRYTLADGRTGWGRPSPVVVWPQAEPVAADTAP